MDLKAALRWLNSAVIASTGNKLREPELVILKGTWRGLTYEQMADGSEYSTNYLMRDVAPKLWKQLSNVFGRSVGKTNFRVALEAYAAANAAVGSELMGSAARGEALSDESGFETDGLGLSEVARRAMGQKDRYWPNGTAAGGGRLSDGGSTRYDLTADFRTRLKMPMYGYDRELMRLRNWLVSGSEGAARAVGIWGLTGVGKTMLAERLLVEVGGSFDRVVVRSLQDKPALGELCAGILAEMGVSSQPVQAVSHLLAVMGRQSVLLLLEDVEAILEPGQLAGDYLKGYQNYEDFFAGATGGRGCVVVTGIEGPAGLVRQGDRNDDMQRMRSLSLSGLDDAAANELLSQEALSGRPESMAAWGDLTQRYQGHPLALKSAARVIREIFDGRVDEFLAQMLVLFTDVLRLLRPSFERLSAAELNILYWLASQEKALSLAELKETLPISLRPAELISALDSLKQRSLLVVRLHSRSAGAVLKAADSAAVGEIVAEAEAEDLMAAPPMFSLPVLVKAYAIHRFVGQFGSGVTGGADRLLEPTISLGSQARSPVKLSQWFEGQFDHRWQPLESLFAAVARPAVRLRSAYRFKDETFVKRCRSVVLSAPGTRDADRETKAVLLLAIHQEQQNLYNICVQAQPATEETVLPEQIELKLLDGQSSVLAAVRAQQADSFIQLPYFQGEMNESFEIELVLGDREYRERFVI